MKKMGIAVVLVETVMAGVLIIGIVSLFTSTPVTRIISPSTPAPDYYSDFHVSMSYIEGWLSGGYRLQIDGKGNVNHTEYHVLRSGQSAQEQRSGKLRPQQLEELIAAAKRVHVWAEWAVKYPSFASIWSQRPTIDLSSTLDGHSEHAFTGGILCKDCATIDLSISFDGHSEQISHSIMGWNCSSPVSPPKGLCDLENQIASIRYLDIYLTPMPASSPTPTIASGDH